MPIRVVVNVSSILTDDLAGSRQDLLRPRVRCCRTTIGSRGLALPRPSSGFRPRAFLEGAADYYDDTLAFFLGADDEDGWWRATDISGQDIVNINPGNIIMASGTGGKVGIGTPTPLESLDVVSAIGVTGGPTVADSNHIIGTPWFNFGGEPQGAWVPGHVKLVTPIQQGEGNMFSIRITGYRYGSGGPPVEIRCGGYAYTGSGTLMQKGCHTEGIGDPVGIGTEGGYVVITIGSKDYSVWYFDHFTFEYSRWQNHEAKDFQWVWVSNQTPSFGNTNNVFINDSAGTVGIGTATPATKLDVQGEIKVGNSGAACDAATVGATRYDSVSDAMQYCAANGGGAVPPAPPVPAWVPYGGGGGLKNITVLKSPGTFTWSAPADTTAVMVELWGGGASGGGGYGKDILNVVPGNSYSVVVGAGGAASAAGGHIKLCYHYCNWRPGRRSQWRRIRRHQ